MLLKCALVQFNYNVGFIAANIARITALYEMAKSANPDIVIFSEMAITGYPPEDLVFNRQFQALSMESAEVLARLTMQGPAILLGGLWCEGTYIHNTALLMEGGRIVHRQYKYHLPNYGIFDEKRHFTAGVMPEPVFWRGIKLGIMICEDMWQPDVAAHLKAMGAELLISINASPFETGKQKLREAIAQKRCEETGLPLIYVNQMGGQDEVVFDGSSFALTAEGTFCARLQPFREDVLILNLRKNKNDWKPEQGVITPESSEAESVYKALVLGLKDFVTKNGFSGIMLGMSGGIDSALAGAIAVDAIGKERVEMLMLPSAITSAESIEDATECARRLGVAVKVIPITAGMRGFSEMVKPYFQDVNFDVEYEVNQTRLRASILMAACLKKHFLLLNTGNKSEVATGYTSIYGDMCGHYAVLKDVYKTMVYTLTQWRNVQGDVIPQRIITKPPSAELHTGQTDQDLLPPYNVLDQILFGLIEERLSLEDLVQRGFNKEMVEKVCFLVFSSEYKRRQGVPGPKISSMHISRDRRYPLTSGWWGMKVSHLPESS